MNESRTDMHDLSSKSSSSLQPFSTQGTPWAWRRLPSSESFFSWKGDCPIFPWVRAKPFAISTPFGKEFHRSRLCCMKKYPRSFWEQLLPALFNSCSFLPWKTQWAAHPYPLSPRHSGFCRPEPIHPHGGLFSRLMSLSLLSQKLSNYTYALLACSQGIIEFSKKVSLPRLTAHPHCRTSFVGWTLSILSINIHTKLVICQWSQIFNHQCVHTLARHEEIHSPALAVSVPATYNTGSLM